MFPKSISVIGSEAIWHSGVLCTLGLAKWDPLTLTEEVRPAYIKIKEGREGGREEGRQVRGEKGGRKKEEKETSAARADEKTLVAGTGSVTDRYGGCETLLVRQTVSPQPPFSLTWRPALLTLSQKGGDLLTCREQRRKSGDIPTVDAETRLHSSSEVTPLGQQRRKQRMRTP